jgi:hypothetical protein
MIGSGSATIIPLERYVIDTGAYVLFEPSIEHCNSTTPTEVFGMNITYTEGIRYPDVNPEFYMIISELRETPNAPEPLVNDPNAIKVDKPYPGYVVAENGTVYYGAMIDNRTHLFVNTTDISLAGFLLKNLRIYPKSQENALVANAVANELKTS